LIKTIKKVKKSNKKFKICHVIIISAIVVLLFWNYFGQ